jgi:ABC-type sulfate transport system permease component
MKWLVHKLHNLRIEWVVGLLLFWVLQVIGFDVTMIVAIFNPKPFTSSLLFTVEISLWALVLTAGVGGVSAWALIQAKHNAAKLADMHADVQIVQEMEQDEAERDTTRPVRVREDGSSGVD